MKIALIGYGKMGKEIEKIALERGHKIVLTIDADNANELNSANLKKADVAIEFTTPETAYENFLKCFEAGVPVVSGTTGWLKKLEEVKSICKTDKKGFFYASNFSVGVNIFFQINKQLAKIMNDHNNYDVSMQETHHIHKLDAPSGTAITLAEGLIKNIDRKTKWELNSTDEKDTIPIEAIREGEVPGRHIIKYNSDIDTIEIKHNAKGRKGFAFGSVLAAEFMKEKTGFYGMEDLLCLTKS